ncbi:MAG: DUF2029 domain-containing protein [Pseudomonadales bacterium]|nr:DUF2029 domain-containing protein [Pseudomonadales bacterium]
MQSRSRVATAKDFRCTRAENGLLIFFIVLASLIALIVSATDSSPEVLYEQNRIDPLVFRAAGNLLRDGESPYSLANQVQNIAADRLNGEVPPFAIPFSYPPNALPLFQLRTLGPPALNAAFHAAVSVLIFLTSLALLTRRYIDNATARLVIVFVAAFWTPGLLDVELSQTGHLAGFLATSFVLTFDRRPLLAGIFLGLLAFKPQYALPLGLLALSRHAWPLILASLATFVASCLLSLLLYGITMWPEFWRSASSLNTTIFHMESWLGAAALLWPDRLEQIHSLGIPVYAVGMALLGTLLYRWRQRLDLLDAAALALVVTILISPNTHPYDLSLFFIPVLFFTRHFRMRIWFVELVFLFFLFPNIFVSVSILRFCFLLLCLALLIWIVSHDAGRQSENSGLPAH